LPAKEDATEKDFFLVSTTCILGDGESTLFWTGPCWMVAVLAPFCQSC
jgi:hypothetical protein